MKTYCLINKFENIIYNFVIVSNMNPINLTMYLWLWGTLFGNELPTSGHIPKENGSSANPGHEISRKTGWQVPGGVSGSYWKGE